MDFIWYTLHYPKHTKHAKYRVILTINSIIFNLIIVAARVSKSKNVPGKEEDDGLIADNLNLMKNLIVWRQMRHQITCHHIFPHDNSPGLMSNLLTLEPIMDAATQTIPRSRSNVEIIVIIIGPDTTDRQICQLFSTSSVEDQIFPDDCGWV